MEHREFSILMRNLVMPTTAALVVVGALVVHSYQNGGRHSMQDSSLGIPPATAERILGQRPNPQMAPGGVVRAQLEALRINNENDDGIAVHYGFSSLGNREVAGSFRRFAQSVKYGPLQLMLRYKAVHYGSVAVYQRRAMMPVVLDAYDGDSHGYLFILSLQATPPYEDCWLTDVVVPIAAPPESNPPPIRRRTILPVGL